MEEEWADASTPLDEEEKRRLVVQLVNRLRCVECGRLYDPEDFVLVHRWQDMWRSYWPQNGKKFSFP